MVAALVGVGNLVITWITRKRVEKVLEATNGMKHELVAEVRKAALLKGHADGVADEKQSNKGTNGP